MNLLPAGFYDILNPDAESEATAAQSLLAAFAEQGYGRVAPPMMEFEETLLSGPGAALNRTTFRVMDPGSQRMLACRPDHTLQIGRIAATRLSQAPRPLRLSYAGAIVRLSGHEQNHARQLTQVGVELIGSLDAEADAEVMMLAIQSLTRLGVHDISLDITLPTLVPSLCHAYHVEGEARKKLHHALDRKDEALVQDVAKSFNGEAGDKANVEKANLEKVCAMALVLMRASGELKRAVELLAEMDLPERAGLDRTRLTRVMELLPAEMHKMMTVDLVESRGFEYQTGLSFAVFSKAIRSELGRGGRYRTATQEPATGFTFYAESLMPVLPRSKSRPRILVPFDISPAISAALAQEGYVILRNLSRNADLIMEAKRQHCHAVLENGKPKLV